NDPAWNIRHLEPDTEYRAVVYYQDHGATQLSTASPVIRFTTLPAGSPVQAEPTSVVVERVPEVSISAASGTINEGEDASFTVTVEPAPDAPLTVRVHVRGPSGGSVVDGTQLGARTVTVGTSGSASFPIPTVDDTHWRSNGMLGASVMFGEGYRQSKFRSHASVYIANNDLPPPPAVQLKRISDSSLTVAWRPQADGTTYTVGWHESFSGIPVPQEVTTTETEHQITGLSPRSHYVVYVLAGAVNLGQLHVRALAAGAPPRTFEVNFDRPAPTPVVSVTADGDLTEGQDASFTVTANPAPEADLDVTLTVSASGDYGAATGPRTVTIPAAGFATLTVATTNDQIEEEDGSLTVTIDPGEAYLVSTTQGSATAAVADDDTAYVVDPGVIVKVKQLASQTQHGSAHVNRWQRVLVAFGEHEGTGVTGGPMTAAEAQQMADAHSSPVWDLVVAELTALEASQQAPTPTPEVNITSAAGGSEGDSVSFTLTASPAPASALTVSVTAVTSGDFGFGALPSSVVIPTSGSATVTITTTDDQTDEPDGSVTLTVNSGSDYTVGALSSQTAGVADDDDPPVPEQTGYTVDPAVVTKVQTLAAQTQHGAAHVNRWQRVLVAFGEHDGTGVAGGAMTAAEAQQMANSYSSPVWDEVVTELTALEAAAQQTPPPPPPPPPPPTPEVNITSASDGSEGGSVSFTLTATPAPAADLPVTVTISVSGDYGVTAGSRTVTIPASGSATLTLATTDDQTDEPDGSVTATLATGSGYTIGSLSAQTAAVADDDDPPVPELVVTPVVSITGGSAITEGGSASFTISANPSPTADIDVTVTVTQSGDFGASTGQRTVRITSGQTSQTFTVSTSDDSTDESDGSITVSLASGSGYTGSGSATVAVADNDDPPQPIEQADPPVDGDLPDVATLTACEGEPELLISSPAASRSDASVDFEVMLSCLPSGNPMILLVPVRDGIIGENLFISLTRDTPSTTVTVDIGGEAALGLAIGWQSGLAGSDVQGDVVFSD
ncbi:MAG: fibronectin type III domain-containing protein, partial [Chloroflexota bacterium]|nr:fibronectin type III domain-containing protein [Chloroflexota bacterium]